MRLVALFDPQSTTSGNVNIAMRPGDAVQLLFVNLSDVNLILTFPDSSQCILAAGQAKYVDPSNWPWATFQWQQLAVVAASIGQTSDYSTTIQGIPAFEVNTDQIVYVEAYDNGEPLVLPQYVSNQMNIANLLKFEDMFVGHVTIDHSFTGTGANPVTYGPTPNAGQIAANAIFYVYGFHVDMTVLPSGGAGGSARAISIVLNNVKGGPTLTFQGYMGTSQPVYITEHFGLPGLISKDVNDPISITVNTNGTISTATGNIELWGGYIPYGG